MKTDYELISYLSLNNEEDFIEKFPLYYETIKELFKKEKYKIEDYYFESCFSSDEEYVVSYTSAIEVEIRCFDINLNLDGSIGEFEFYHY
jgi:hypothetical protein